MSIFWGDLLDKVPLKVNLLLTTLGIPKDTLFIIKELTSSTTPFVTTAILKLESIG